MARRISEIQAVIAVDATQYEAGLAKAENSAKGFARASGQEFKKASVYIREMISAAGMGEKEFAKLRRSVGDILSTTLSMSARSLLRAFLPAGAITGAIYAIINAESDAEKAAKSYGMTLETVNQRYKDLVTGADKAAAATLGVSAAFREAQQGYYTQVQSQMDAARREIDRLTEYALGGTIDPAAGLIRNIEYSVPDEFIKSLREMNKGLQDGSISAQEAEIRIGTLREEVGKKGGMPEFTKVLDQLAVQLAFVAKNADSARIALNLFKPAAALLMEGEKLIEKETQAQIRKEYEKTDAGRRESLVEARDIAQARAKLYAGTDLEAKTLTNLAQAQKDLAAFDKGIAKSSGASSLLRERASAIRSITDEIAKLTMTEEAYAAKQHGQEVGKALSLGISPGLIAQLSAAQVISGKNTQKSFTEATKALQEFEKEYRQAFKTGTTVTASISAEMNKFRDAARAAGLSGEELAAVLQRIQELQTRCIEDAATDAASGARRAFRNYEEDATNAAKNVESAVNSSMSSMEDALVNFVATGKMEFSSLVNSIIADLARISIREGITGPLASGLKDLFGGGASSAYAGGGMWKTASGLTAGAVTGHATGGVFSAPTLSAYSNSIVSKPTLFPFAKGIGLMGEAGAEAIMPLTRTSGGDLGVKVDVGSQDTQAPQVNIQIVDQRGSDAPEVEVQQAPNANGGMDYKIIIKSEQQRNMASGSMDSIMRNRYGIRPQVVGR